MMSLTTPLLLLLLVLCNAGLARVDMRQTLNPGRSFTIDNDQFYKDGVPFRILGGSLHYFRVHPQYWEDRLLRAKSLGLNVIQTYVPWNLHQPQPDRLNFEENTTADLEGFLKVAQKLDLLVMLRPGPYICGEWDFGGFPAWLLAVQPALNLRTSDTNYLSLVDRWWDVLLPKVVPYLYSEGGPVIMVQVENEYGSFGADKVYMRHLLTKAKAHLGEDVILYTTDGADMGILKSGSLYGEAIYTAVDFAVEQDPAAAFELQKLFNPPGRSPLLSSEFYTGWLTHWGEPVAHVGAEYTAAALDRVLQLNASVVLYMVHGGTNFGFSSGSNTGGTASAYSPDITSYDYDAPIGESGTCDSEKFTALRRVLSNYSSFPLPNTPPLPARKAFGTLELLKLSSLFQVLESVSTPPNGILMDKPSSMEMLGQVSGFILYRSILPAHTIAGSKLLISEVRDRAQVFVTIPTGRPEGTKTATFEKIHVGTLERWFNQKLQLPAATAVPGLQLDILVENMGRVNYGPYIYDQKGITNSVFLDGISILGWTVFPIPLENIEGATSGHARHQLHVEQKSLLKEFGQLPATQVATDIRTTEGPTFYKGWLDVDKPADTFVSLTGWSKGVVFINGFNLGRYWPVRGPQCTLYIPAPLLQSGGNELILLELDAPQKEKSVAFTNESDFSCGPSSASSAL